MSLNRYAKRRDANEPEIVAALRSVGAQVWLHDQPVDLNIGFRGRFIWAEVKLPGKAHLLKPSQREFLELARTLGLPAGVVTTPREALELVGAVNP